MKDWYKSKTFWFNVAYLGLMVIGAVLTWFGYDEFVPGEDLVVIGTALVAIVNIILRYFFTQTALR